MSYTKPESGQIADISAPQLKQTKLPAETILIDVREQDEWDEGHIEGAHLFPLSKLMQGEIPSLDKNQDVIIYCKGGVRSLQAAHILQQRGYPYLTNVSGGYDLWLIS